MLSFLRRLGEEPWFVVTLVRLVSITQSQLPYLNQSPSQTSRQFLLGASLCSTFDLLNSRYHLLLSTPIRIFDDLYGIYLIAVRPTAWILNWVHPAVTAVPSCRNPLLIQTTNLT
ncbi:hypothetical protein HHX47_DHR5000464 [Lentinula edodes]|nr:hypothetical protein HHX47_DHR5000464 [Lentinula edodes]